MLAKDALEPGPERQDGRPRALVPRVRLELDPHGAQLVEGVGQHELLRLDVDPGPPGRRCQPRPADLQAPVGRHDREIAGAAHHAAGPGVERGERYLRAGVAGDAGRVACGHDVSGSIVVTSVLAGVREAGGEDRDRRGQQHKQRPVR